MFADNQCRYLIDELDSDYYPCPDPQPCRNLHNGNQPYCAASDKADVRHTIQNGTGFTLGVQPPRKITIQHITDAAETIDYPECHTCRIKQKKADGSENSERRDYVWNTLHTSRFQLPHRVPNLQSKVMLSIRRRRVPEGTWASAISPTFLPIRAAPIGDFSDILPASRSIS